MALCLLGPLADRVSQVIFLGLFLRPSAYVKSTAMLLVNGFEKCYIPSLLFYELYVFCQNSLIYSQDIL